MKKPYGVEEFDGYPMPDVSSERKPLSSDEQEKISTELKRKISSTARIIKNENIKSTGT